MGNTSSNLFGGDSGEEVDWRGIPIPKKKEQAPPVVEEDVEAQIKSLEAQIEALKGRLVDAEGAD